MGGRDRPFFWATREGDVWGDVHERPDLTAPPAVIEADTRRRKRAEPSL